eukprot:scaffold12674_cov35-Attheya_sp.AAC.1
MDSFRSNGRDMNSRLWGMLDRKKMEPIVLVPEENPTLDPTTMESVSGVLYKSVLTALLELYPPVSLEKRNSASRTDGYWKFVESGQTPPKELTYGEFDLLFFAQLLDRAVSYHSSNHDDEKKYDTPSWDNKVFVDLGSGTGRLVLGAAALHPGFRQCRGLELLEGIHGMAQDTLESCRRVKIVDDTIQTQIPESNVLDEDEMNNTGVYEEETDDMPKFAWLEEIKETIAAMSPEEFEHFEQDEEVEEEDADFFSFDEINSKDANGEIDNAAIIAHQHDPSDLPVNDLVSDLDDDEHFEVTGTETESTTLEQDGEFLSSHVLRVPVVSDNTGMQEEHLFPLAPIEFSCGSFEDPYEYLGDVDVAFCFSSCLPPTVLQNLGRAIGRQCKPGTIVITTEFPLALEGNVLADNEFDPLLFEQDYSDEEPIIVGSYTLELLEQVDGWCWLLGGKSTAYIHRVLTSCWTEDSKKLERPVLSIEEQAYRICKLMEAGELTDSRKFLRNVRNNMVFLGFPQSWLPNPNYDDDNKYKYKNNVDII